MSKLNTYILIVALLLIPVAIGVEKANQSLWNNRLIIPNFITEPDRHTPIYDSGTEVPSVIDNDLTFTSNDNPVILEGTVLVEKNATLTIEPGTNIYANEFAELRVEGTLNINGTKSTPVTLASNETHEMNQAWAGIIASDTSNVSIAHAVFSSASPAVSCLDQSRVNIEGTGITAGSTGVFFASSSCSLSNSNIKANLYGVIDIGGVGKYTNNEVVAGKQSRFIIQP